MIDGGMGNTSSVQTLDCVVPMGMYDRHDIIIN